LEGVEEESTNASTLAGTSRYDCPGTFAEAHAGFLVFFATVRLLSFLSFWFSDDLLDSFDGADDGAAVSADPSAAAGAGDPE